MVWMDHSLTIQPPRSPVKGHFTYFQFLVIMNKADMSICEQVFVCTCFSILFLSFSVASMCGCVGINRRFIFGLK